MNVRNEAKQILMAEGLSENASRTYLTLLAMGSGNLSGIASRVNLHPQSVKNALVELGRDGLVSSVGHKLSRTLFKPAPPYAISKRLHERHESYIKLLPELAKTFRQAKTRFFSVYEGKQTFVHHLIAFIQNMRQESKLRVLSYPGGRFDTLLESKYSTFEALRQEARITKQVLISYRDRSSMRERQDLLREPASEYRAHPAVDGPLVEFISDQGIFFYFHDPSEPAITIVESKEYASQSSRLFDNLWQTAKKA